MIILVDQSVDVFFKLFLVFLFEPLKVDFVDFLVDEFVDAPIELSTHYWNEIHFLL